MALTQIAKWGNSLGVRIPKSILEDAHIQNNDEVSVSCINGSIVIKKLRRIGDYRLICFSEDDSLIILALSVGHRRDVYNE